MVPALIYNMAPHTRAGRLVAPVAELNYILHYRAEMIDLLKRGGSYIPRAERLEAGKLFRFWRAREAQLRLTIVAIQERLI